MSHRQRIQTETYIPAPLEAVYAALLDPETHARTALGRERVVAGPSSLGLGDEVTFEATHFGVRQRLTARITAADPPNSFEDTQVRGFFRSMVHRHEFVPAGEGTRMVDTMTFSSPLGRLFDRFVLGPYLRRWRGFFASRATARGFRVCRCRRKAGVADRGAPRRAAVSFRTAVA